MGTLQSGDCDGTGSRLCIAQTLYEQVAKCMTNVIDLLIYGGLINYGKKN